MTAALRKPNAVRGYPRWTYGLKVRARDGRLRYFFTFDLERDDGATIERVIGSVYRTTALARQMGVRDLRGYEHAARVAIRKYEDAE